METNIIGHFDIYPLTLQTKQVFILRLLTPLAEYQDFVPVATESQILSVVKKYLNVKDTRDARLGFEACRLLGSLFCHKKYTLEWVYTGALLSIGSYNNFLSSLPILCNNRDRKST